MQNLSTGTMSHRILLVDDEIDILEFVRYNLQKEGYEVFTAQNGAEALKAAAECRPHLILLDMMMPVMDGAQTCRAIRQDPQLRDTMVVFLSALGEEDQQLTGFGVGADDYLTKPFDPEELLARVGAMTRRKGAMVLNEISFQDLTLDLNTVTLRCGARDVQLSPKEFALARLMLSEPSMTYSKDLLISRAWGLDSEATDNNVEAYISFLRKKLRYLGSKVGIRNLQKIGYRLEVAP